MLGKRRVGVGGKDVLRRWVGRKSLCWGEGCIEGKDVLRRWVGRKGLC